MKEERCQTPTPPEAHNFQVTREEIIVGGLGIGGLIIGTSLVCINKEPFNYVGGALMIGSLAGLLAKDIRLLMRSHNR